MDDCLLCSLNFSKWYVLQTISLEWHKNVRILAIVWAYFDPSTSFIGFLLKRIYLERNLVPSVLMLHQSRNAFCFVATILTAVFFSFAKITRNNYINLSSSNKVAIYFFGKMPNIGSVSFGKNYVCYGSKWFTWPSSTAVVKCHFESSDTRLIPWYFLHLHDTPQKSENPNLYYVSTAVYYRKQTNFGAR